MAAKAAKMWAGPEALRRQLVPIDDVRPHPSNPRRGAVDEIANSLARFGQLRPILIDADGTIIAGNHTWRAASDLGWTHIAAIPNDFSSPDEARAYLLADNRLADLGDYERAELVGLLTEVEESGSWDGTGYTPDDLAHMRALDERAAVPPPAPSGDGAGPTAPPSLREIVLLYDEEQLSVVAGNIRTLRTRYGLEDVTETVVEAVRRESLRLNQGEA